MKKALLLLPVLALAACDRPQYDLQMVCEDGAHGDLLVDAKIYKSHADLAVKLLYKDLRAKARGEVWLADHVWLYNQIPQIDDTIDLSLPATEHGDYEIPDKIKLEMYHGGLAGGLKFELWHAVDNNLTMSDGYKILAGQYRVGTTCEPVLYPVDVPEKIPMAQRKEIKNCLAYVGSQVLFDNTATETRLRVYDEKTGREMYIGSAAINEIFGGIEPHHFYLGNKNPEDTMQACDVAARLRAYIAAHIDAEHIPEPKNVVSVSAGETITLTLGDEEIVVRGK